MFPNDFFDLLRPENQSNSLKNLEKDKIDLSASHRDVYGDLSKSDARKTKQD